MTEVIGARVPRRPKRLVLALLGAGALLAVGGIAASYRAIVASIVTRAALADAEELARDVEDLSVDYDRLAGRCGDRYGEWFARGFLDRDMLLNATPVAVTTSEAVPSWLVFGAYCKATMQRWKAAVRVGRSRDVSEVLPWVDLLCRRPKAKEILVELFASDYTLFRTRLQRDRDGGLLKLYLFAILFGGEDRVPRRYDNDFLEPRKRCLAALGPEHWRAVLRDLEHPREKVRAGALLLLYHHPDRELFVTRARAALRDPSEWVRLAAAGTLALRADGSGILSLLCGLRHPRWELRWWSGLGIAVLRKKRLAASLHVAELLERDDWVRGELREWAEGLRALPAGQGAP